MTHMKHQPPYKDPSEAIQYIRTSFYTKVPRYILSWREVAAHVSEYMDGETSKGEVWNIAHKKYKCPPAIAKALRKMNLLDDKRYGFFFRVTNKEEYDRVKGWLGEESFSSWVRRKASSGNGEADAGRSGGETA